MKKIIIFVLTVLIIAVGAYVAYSNLNREEEISNQDIVEEDNNYFEELIKYKAESINDEENLYELVRKLELGEYLINIEKEFDGEKEYITLYYDCTDENYVRKYFAKFNNPIILEENAVALFALINKLEKVSYNFNISDTELADEYHLTIIPGIFSTSYFIQTREQAEQNYNQDVRNYVENPKDFMKYNMDFNVSNITIYMIDYMGDGKEINTLEIEDKTQVDYITQYIENENLKSTGGGCLNSICTTWMDLNNGYIIGLVGESQGKDYVIVLKGKGEEAFTETSIKIGGNVNKTLPKGLIAYVKEIIENSTN